MGLLSPRAPFSVLCQHESALKRSESPCRWRRVRKLGARWSLLQAHGRVERPGSANFDHVELARECGWERRVRAMAFDDAPDRFIDFRHTAGDHKSDRLDRAITSNGHRHHGRRVRPLRQFADGVDRGVELDLAGRRFSVLNKFHVGVAAAPQPDAARRAQRVGKRVGRASDSLGRVTLCGFFIELAPDGPKHRIAFRRLVFFGLHTSRFPPRGLLPLRFQPGYRLSGGVLAFGLQPRSCRKTR